MVGVYAIENIKNNKMYIGKSKNIDKRWKRHKSTFKNESEWNKEAYKYPLYEDMRKLGLENFRFFIVEECKEDILDKTEVFYINMLNPEYNQTIGENSKVTRSLINENDFLEIVDLLKNTKMSFKEIGKLYGIKDNSIRSINHGRMWKSKHITYPVRIYEYDYTRVEKTINKCSDCGIVIMNISKRCFDCEIKNKINKSKIPDRETLKEDIRRCGFVKTGDIYGVSDNAIRKWCIKYHLPSKTRDVKKYSDEDWLII